jgi:hypothetical protein
MFKQILGAVSALAVIECTPTARAEEPKPPASEAPRTYPFLIVDDPARMTTMKMVDEDYLSAYRYVVRLAEDRMPDTGLRVVQCLASLLLIPLTHEEGHRSVLTAAGIGFDGEG